MGMDGLLYSEMMPYQSTPSYITEEKNKLDARGNKWNTTCSKLPVAQAALCKSASVEVRGNIQNYVKQLYREGASSEIILEFNSIAMDLYDLGMEKIYKDLKTSGEEEKAQVERLKPKERSAASSEPIVAGTGKDFAQKQMQKTFVCPTKKSNHKDPEDVEYTFPSKKIIGEYLENHPATDDRYLKEKGVIDAAAKAFGDQTKVRIGIALGSTLIVEDLREKLPESSLGMIQTNLNRALDDCADGKVIEKK